MPVTRKIGILLLLPVAGAMVVLVVFYLLYMKTAHDAPLINLAGRERLLAQQLLAEAERVHTGHNQDRPILTELTNQFDQSLRIIEQGGELQGRSYQAAPSTAQTSVAEIRASWNDQQKLLRLVAAQPANDPDNVAIYDALRMRTPELVNIIDKTVIVLQERNQAMQQRVFLALLGAAGLDIVLLVAGIMIIRQYVNERVRLEGALQVLAAGASSAVGNDFLQTLVVYLAKTLNLDYALVAEVKDNNRATTVAVCADGRITENFEYMLEGTPCRNVLTDRFCHIPHGVATRFPDDKLLADMKAESYLGAPMFDAEGRTMGLLAAFGRRPLTDATFAKSIFQIFAARAASELERKRSEDALRQSEQRLHRLAHYDHLTELPNRLLFLDRLNQAMARARWHKRLVAVMFLDLDRFKIINDTMGHSVGDLILRVVAERLAGSVRAGDTVARFGGDEFAIALTDIDNVHDIPHVAEKVVGTVGAPIVVDGHEYFVTSSIGISLHPEDGEDAETLLRNADIAMYRAKERGKNNYQFYSQVMSAEAPRLLTLETDLRHALDRNEFLLHYQPKVNLADGRVIGVEALLRWRHPKEGMVSPLDFIPLLEETGLIEPVGEWVVHTACVQSKAWQMNGRPPLRVAVNLSARQFQQSKLNETVGRTLSTTGLDPRGLEFEITESVLMEHTEDCLAILQTFHDMGIHIALDDFGTGYSSLSYLRRFPIDTLKIDRAFIRDVTTNPDDAAIAMAVIAMAHSLRLDVVAEGVETREQLEFLRAHQCDQVQGYYFSRPLSAEAFTEFCDEYQRMDVNAVGARVGHRAGL